MLKRLVRLVKERFQGETGQLEARFTEVYEKRLWVSEESASGVGSDRTSGQVVHAIELLTRFTAELNLQSIADVPCGDFNWMPLFLDQHPEVAYRGYDVVPAIIAANRAHFPEREFRVLDITRKPPARADLVFSKDMVNHLKEDDVWATLKNMVASRPKYLMITSNRGFEHIELDDSHANASRHLDLEAAPFSLPTPIYADHYMSLWVSEDVERRLDERQAEVREDLTDDR